MKKKKPDKTNNKDNTYEYYDIMKCNKDSLKNIIRDDVYSNGQSINEKLTDAIFRTNKIVIHTYQFIKLYILHLYHNNKKFPVLDKHFIDTVMKIVSVRKNKSGSTQTKETQKLTKILKTFYEMHYKETIEESDIIYDDKLSYILAYEQIDMITNIKVNIQEHYIEHIKKFINITFDTRNKMKKISDNTKLSDTEKKKRKKKLYDEIYQIYSDILNVEDAKLSSKKKYHQFIKTHKKKLLPNKKVFDKNSVHYDLCSNTFDYLRCMIYLNLEMSKLSTDENEIKLFNVLPLRNKIKGSYTTFDTCALISLFCDKNKGKELKGFKDNQYEIWNRYFKINKKVFKKKHYLFNFMIKTDGIGTSILFIKEKDGKPIKKTFGLLNKLANIAKSNNDKYIEDVENINELLYNKKLICVDPNKSDIVYCVDDKNKHFRYTQNQRRLETRNKKYNRITDKLSKNTKINDKSVKELETILSNYNSKTCNFDQFKKFIKEKNNVNRLLFHIYSQEIYRKLKWNRFINTQKSESKFLNNFQNKFGDPKNTIVVVGDYDEGNNHMKGKEPIINKKIRKLLTQKKYDVYKINEYNTSKLCCRCHQENSIFHERESKNPKNKGKIISVWGLLCCKNIKCKTIFNRDVNSCLNMHYIIKKLKETGKRCPLYTRDTQLHA